MKRKTEIDESVETSWNLSEWKINLIGELLRGATHHFNRGKYVNCLNSWKSIRMLISNRLTDKENEQAEKWEIDIMKKGKWIKNYRQKKFMTNNNFVHCLQQYVTLVNDYLRKIGMDIQEKTESSLF